MSARTNEPGRLLMVGLPGSELDPPTVHRLERIGPSGVILFARNLVSPEQTRRLLERLRELLPPHPLLAIDQEGGKVSRLKGWVGPTPPATVLARAGADATRRFGEATAHALLSLGFNLDFAPVVDLCSPEAQNGIGDRSFGTDPERAATFAGAFLEGLQGAGVAGCLKHFPGLGSTSVDSHERLPADARRLEQLETHDLVPYRRLADRAASVMIGHAAYPAIDPRGDCPASLSTVIVSDLLRGSLAYRGLIVSDDLEMGAVAPLDRDGAAAVRSVAAGCDLLLYCADLDRAERAVAALARRTARDPDFARRVERAAVSVEATGRRWAARPPAPPEWVRALDELRGFAELA